MWEGKLKTTCIFIYLERIESVKTTIMHKRRVPQYYEKIKHYLTHKNEVNETKILSYYEELG